MRPFFVLQVNINQDDVDFSGRTRVHPYYWGTAFHCLLGFVGFFFVFAVGIVEVEVVEIVLPTVFDWRYCHIVAIHTF